MRAIDWLIFIGFLVYVVWDGARRGRRHQGAEDYFLAGRSIPWWAMGLSIMATQASAITMVGTTGKGMRDGMGFLQFYFALPVAMVILCFTLVPLFHRLRVFTAYEYLGERFDRKTRLLSATIFLVLRSLSLGIVIYTPSVILATMFGIPPLVGVLTMGVTALAYTTIGGLRAVIATDVKQMAVMVLGLVVVFFTVIVRLPDGVGLGEAWQLAAQTNHLEFVDWRWDPSTRYTIPSALIGGLFLFLAYFGCDQSQVQRHLAGRSLRDKQRALLLNALLKIPFQFLVLFTGVLIFVFFLFQTPPVSFLPGESKRISRDYQQRMDLRHDRVEAAARRVVANPESEASTEELRAALSQRSDLQADYRATTDTKDVNYIFPHFILAYLPMGVVGLIFAAIFAAALSSIDSELNSMSTVAVMDIYRAGFGGTEESAATLRVARLTTIGLGLLATGVALYADRLGSVIDAVNEIGSYFYGSLLGVFILAVAVPRRLANGHGAFVGLIAGVVVVGYCARDGLSFLYLNPIGALTVLGVGVLVSVLLPERPAT